MRAYSENTHFFRFAPITPQMAEELNLLLKEKNCIARVGKLIHSDKASVVIKLNVNAPDTKSLLDLIKNLIRVKKLRSNQYGIGVSLITAFIDDKTMLPLMLSEFHQEIGGKIDFSWLFFEADSEA